MTTAALPRTATWRELVTLTKPRITLFVLLTGFGGMMLAPTRVAPLRAALLLAGIALVIAGANVLNMVLERDSDGLMERTRNRPLPAGRLATAPALAFGLVLSAAALVVTFLVSPPAGWLSLLSLVLYVLAYTPLKKHTPVALLVGAVPGAMPPLLGWVGATGTVDAGGLGLFAVLFLWQVPHFLAIALFRESEYGRAGIQTLPVRHGGAATERHIILYTGFLVAASLGIAATGLGGPLYLVVALALGVGFLWLALQQHTDVVPWARRLFFYSLVYLPALLVGLGVDRLLGLA